LVVVGPTCNILFLAPAGNKCIWRYAARHVDAMWCKLSRPVCPGRMADGRRDTLHPAAAWSCPSPSSLSPSLLPRPLLFSSPSLSFRFVVCCRVPPSVSFVRVVVVSLPPPSLFPSPPAALHGVQGARLARCHRWGLALPARLLFLSPFPRRPSSVAAAPSPPPPSPCGGALCG